MISRLRLQVFVASVGFIAIIIALAYFLLAVQRETVPARGGTYIEGVVVDTNPNLIVNPVLQANDLSKDVAALVFSGLTKSASNGAIVPDLAESWGPNEKGDVWEFRIRRDARWQDGFPVTAKDVAFTVGLIKNKDFVTAGGPADLADIWKDIEVDRLGDYAVRFRLATPWTPFLNYTSFGLLPEHVLGKVPVGELAKNDFNLKPIGSGPYQILPSGFANDSVTLTQNPYYYSEKPYLEKVWFKYFPSPRAALTALENKQVDAVSELASADVATVGNDKTVKELSAPLARNTFFFLNNSNPLFATKEIRQALSYAINKKDLVQQEIGAQGKVSNSPILAFSWAYKPDIKTYDYDAAKARQMLEDAGWRLSGEGVRQKDGQTFTFQIKVLPQQVSIAQRIAGYLRDVGIVAQVTVIPGAQTYSDDLFKRRYDAVIVGVRSVINDPDPFQTWHSSQAAENKFNFSNWKNDKADRLLEESRVIIFDPASRKAKYQDWQAIWADDMPSIPLYYQSYVYAISTKVQNLAPQKLDFINEPSDRFKDIASRYVLTNTKFGN